MLQGNVSGVQFTSKKNISTNPAAIKMFLRNVGFNVVRHVGLLLLLMLIYWYRALRAERGWVESPAVFHCFAMLNGLGCALSEWNNPI